LQKSAEVTVTLLLQVHRVVQGTRMFPSPEGRRAQVDDRSLRQQLKWISLARASQALWVMVAGTVLDVATVIVCALNAVSVQQAVAMALPAGLITAGGFIAFLIPDPWCAWRRGFRHGCEAAARCEPCPAVDVAQKGLRNVRLRT
jgi:hypothetical protein